MQKLTSLFHHFLVGDFVHFLLLDVILHLKVFVYSGPESQRRTAHADHNKEHADKNTKEIISKIVASEWQR